MSGRAKRDTVTADVGVVGRGRVQDVRAVDFLGLLEGLHQAEVRGLELRLVQVVIDGFARDGITKGNFVMLLVVHITLTSAVVEGGLAAFGLQLGKTEVAHFSGTLQRQLGVMLGEDFVVLRWDHLVLAFNPPQAGEQKVLNC